ncbi:MAG: peptide chain release factor-like protein, partial [Planctomycetota bacterium]
GQHRNKVETAVILTHEPTGISAEASERRSQAQNLVVALRRLRTRLAVDYRTPAPAVQPPAPTERWRQRVRAGRIAVSEEHTDFPALLAEALDTLARFDWDDRASAAWLGLTRTQLTRFLQTEPRALEALNRVRRERGQADRR